MPQQVFKNAYLWINGVDLSATIAELALGYEAGSADATVMGSNSKVMQGTLKSQSLDVTFFQRYTCVDATLFGLVGCQTCIEVRACNACSTDTNPRYASTWLVQSYPPMSGKVGDLLQTKVKFEPAGDLSRAITSP